MACEWIFGKRPHATVVFILCILSSGLICAQLGDGDDLREEECVLMASPNSEIFFGSEPVVIFVAIGACSLADEGFPCDVQVNHHIIILYQLFVRLVSLAVVIH